MIFSNNLLCNMFCYKTVTFMQVRVGCFLTQYSCNIKTTLFSLCFLSTCQPVTLAILSANCLKPYGRTYRVIIVCAPVVVGCHEYGYPRLHKALRRQPNLLVHGGLTCETSNFSGCHSRLPSGHRCAQWNLLIGGCQPPGTSCGK